MTNAPLRILIADDDSLVRFIARVVVEKAGMVAVEAANGAEAIALIAAEDRIDLILLDLEMPIVGGLEVLRRMRADPKTPRIPVLVLTGAGGDEIRKAMALGAVGIFPKPIAADSLLTRIRNWPARAIFQAMFTGLIEEVGTIKAIANGPAGRELSIRSAYQQLVDGESIAVNGVCLTVREHDGDSFTVGAIETTLGRTTVGDWAVGRRVNLERAMVAGARLGGHLVAGHVDGVGTVKSVDQQGDARLVALALPEDLMELSVLHGSITVDGVSLTVNALPPDGTLQLSLIEYTLRQTTLGELEPGNAVNVESDLIGKYVQKLMEPYKSSRA